MERKTWLGILSGCLWGFVASLLSSIIPGGALFAPGLLAIVGVRAGALGFVLAGAGFSAGSLLFLDGAGLGMIVLCMLPALMLIVFSKRVSHFETLVLTSGGALVGQWASIGINSLLTGEDKMAAFFQLPSQFIKENIALVEAQAQQVPDFAPVAETYKAFLTAAEGILRYAAPAIMIGIAMATGLITVLMVSRSVRRSGREGFMLSPFSKWHLPRSFALGMTAILIVSMIGDAEGWPNFEAVSMCAQIIFVSAYALAGCATFDALFIRLRAGKALRWVFSLSILVFTGGTIPMWVGIIDSLFGIRRRMEQPPSPQ